MTPPQTYWDGDTLMHHWYGSSQADEVAFWNAKSKRLHYEGQDAETSWKFYEKPSPDECMAKILNYQNFE